MLEYQIYFTWLKVCQVSKGSVCFANLAWKWHWKSPNSTIILGADVFPRAGEPLATRLDRDRLLEWMDLLTACVTLGCTLEGEKPFCTLVFSSWARYSAVSFPVSAAIASWLDSNLFKGPIWKYTNAEISINARLVEKLVNLSDIHCRLTIPGIIMVIAELLWLAIVLITVVETSSLETTTNHVSRLNSNLSNSLLI